MPPSGKHPWLTVPVTVEKLTDTGDQLQYEVTVSPEICLYLDEMVLRAVQSSCHEWKSGQE